MARQDATNYSALVANEGNPFGVQMMSTDGNDTEDERAEDTDNDGLMIHVVPDTSKGEVVFNS